MKRLWAASLCALSVSSVTSAIAAEPAACRDVRFADVGWSDIAATTGLASTVLEGLGYKPTKTIASVPITFAGVKSKQIDVFLGYWSPTMDPMIDPFKKAGQVNVLPTPNLTGAKYTLAVPDYAYQAGIKSFADIAKNYDKLGGKIYGIEPGNDGNALIKKMIDSNQYGLGKFKLVESSEAGMLVEVNRSIRDKKPIVFLGWEPHPMNVQMKIDYLSGGDDVFGPNYGEAKVMTVTPTDYATRCPNVAKLVSNLHFTTDIENHVMMPIMNKVDPNKAAREWLKANPAVLDQWLAGVKTFDGKDGLPAVKAFVAGK
ncbi:choline ABC transporter substrate-binding protein [Paraburkholderia sp. SIMBA_055]|jgi:glycine betaine/proline transport system substrate-binding protein|uniref:Choline ABC transporter, periplasmic binding protein n=2 Tax=Paraburkholderia graminis TaxID=60548 RepID=B1G883_PARG4|nr:MULTISPECIES: choline ABC transporter substrate-binding protein [Paraburkholderia]ALE59367.1 glycine/betaine ABC transporter substrate-binding protein [Burkholderia sp. HB1]EDT07659.1 choline ABC transporter, periplasmic binding protein [Paraburkholderia graminis C4D1M]MDQ0625557.1 glycine betaine/proline transport system substrate-binding protein [Paraburkholderia graminis]MDR6204081.1 glycine betaine/proline transport system substrate-binding protein [Paraburkholderia graminis]MDR6476274.